MDHIADLNERSRQPRESEESELGIFWLIDDARLMRVLLSVWATRSGPNLTHAITHEREWRMLRTKWHFPGLAIRSPLARSCGVRSGTGSFQIIVDRCITPDTPLFDEIRSALRLPSETHVVIDEQYRCHACRDVMSDSSSS